MTVDLLKRPTSSEALSDCQWRSDRRRGAFVVDATSEPRIEEIPFGRHTLLVQPLPLWSRDLLRKIGELLDLEEDWDSYGARPVDPQCAVATAYLVLRLLDSHTPKPSIVPTTRGGIQLEWHRAGANLEIEVESLAKLHVFFEDEQTGSETELTLSDNLLPLAPFLKRLNAAD